jgi:hypothetical protein
MRIHCWGGLGSQLFAVAMAYRCQELFPSRQIRVVLHTGGVTYREPEILELFPEIRYSQVNDYLPPAVNNKFEKVTAHQQVFPKFQLGFLLKLLKKFRLVVSADNLELYEKVRFWTISLRGHYSYVPVREDFLIVLNSRLTQEENLESDPNRTICGIHYRLGDLVGLDSKQPTSLAALVQEHKRVCSSMNFNTTKVFTDSPELVNSFSHSFENMRMEVPVATTVATMSELLDTHYFIGTSSKVSFWVAALRSKVGKRSSSIPSINQSQMASLVDSIDPFIHYYKT